MSAASSPIAKALSAWRDPAAWMKVADIVAVLLALSLPWSTSLVGIFGVVLLITVVPTLELKGFLESLKRPISALPIALFVLALGGTLWSDAAWGARFYAVGPAAKPRYRSTGANCKPNLRPGKRAAISRWLE